MDIFISWSGARSLAVAEALRDWLPTIINAAEPFLSIADIDKGARWISEVAGRLEKSKAGIICLTPANMGSYWLLFEAGALSKTVSNTHVCPLLIGLRPSDVKGPLAQFQFTSTSKSDMLDLFKTLNSALGEAARPEAQIERAFGLVWPQLDDQIKRSPLEEMKGSPQRSEREILEEMLELVRNLNRPSTVEVPNVSGRMPGGDLADRNRIIEAALTVYLESHGDALEAVAIDPWGSQVYVTVRAKSGLMIKHIFDNNVPSDLMIDILMRRLNLIRESPSEQRG